jgi:hypothetical protein
VLDGVEAVLGLLGGLQHGLKSLPLMSCIKRLNGAMLGEVAIIVGLKTRVKAMLKSSTHAYREVMMAGERASSAHQLLEVRLNQTDNLIPIAVLVDLADMSNSGVWLTRVARAQLEKQGVADCHYGKLQNFGLDIKLHFVRISSG